MDPALVWLISIAGGMTAIGAICTGLVRFYRFVRNVGRGLMELGRLPDAVSLLTRTLQELDAQLHTLTVRLDHQERELHALATRMGTYVRKREI